MRSMLLAVLTFALPAAAAPPNTCSTPEDTVEIVNLGPVFSMAAAPAPAAVSTANAARLDVIANLGQRIWKVVVDNKPVVDAKTQYATALPMGVTDWSAMEGWQPTVATVYELKVKNAFCATVVDLQYQVLRTAGGSYKGAGKYLTAVTIQPMFLEVAWGYHVSVEASVPDSSIVNVGTLDKPVAAMTAELAWRVSTPIKDIQGKSLYYMQGDGVYREIGGP
jgi:hypothetical protein